MGLNEKVSVVRLTRAGSDTLGTGNELLCARGVNLGWHLIQGGIETGGARVVETVRDSLLHRDVRSLEIACRLIFILTELEWCCIDDVLHEVCFGHVNEVNKVIFSSELYVLELCKVRYVKRCFSVSSDLWLSIASLKVYAILIKGLLRAELTHVKEVVLR